MKFKFWISTEETGNQSQQTNSTTTGSKETKAPKGAESKEKCTVHNLLILDESGSMELIYQPALTGVNETLQTIRGAQKEHPGQEHFVTLVSFSTSHYNEIYHHTPATEARDITANQYRPGGGTPLYDAMGRAITDLTNHVRTDDVVLVTIITDGYENSSEEYSGQAIKALVESRKAKGWVFTYIGANQNVEAVATSMSIDNHLEFKATHQGTVSMFQKESACRRRFFDNIQPGASRSKLAKGFFDEDPEEKKEGLEEFK